MERMAMAATTDFDDWLDEAEPPSHGDVYALYEAVRSDSEFAGYKCERTANGQWIVSAQGVEAKLRLATPAAKDGFLRRIGGRYVGESGMDVGAWHVMQHGLSKDD